MENEKQEYKQMSFADNWLELCADMYKNGHTTKEVNAVLKSLFVFVQPQVPYLLEKDNGKTGQNN